MTDFDFKEIEMIAKEKEKKDAEKIKKIREEIMRHIAEITKDLPKSTTADFSNPTKDQKKDIQKQESKYGKVVINKEDEVKRKKIAINKYSGNGRLPLHESIVIGAVSRFVTLTKTGENGGVDFNLSEEIETSTDILIPKGTIDTQTPLPYIFSSKDEFSKYLKLAIIESLDSLYSKVDSVIRKYVNVEEHYYPLLTGDIIWSYFQDKETRSFI